MKKCSECNGTGEVKKYSHASSGFTRPCPSCKSVDTTVNAPGRMIGFESPDGCYCLQCGKKLTRKQYAENRCPNKCTGV